jgi:DNA-binding XRE family transcriptional regulator
VSLPPLTTPNHRTEAPVAAKTAEKRLSRKEKELLNEHVKVRLRYARNHADLTQQQLADMIGADRIQVVHWEAGTNRPSERYRERWADVTGFPVSFFDHDGPR